MKKIVLILSVAALALASCVKTSDVYTGSPDSREIVLSPLNQPLTRSAVSGAQTSFPDQTIYVSAYQSAPAAKDYFGDIAFEKNYAGGSASGASDNTWGGTTAQYWPLAAATLNFLAVTEGPTGTTHQFGTEVAQSNPVTYEHYANQVVVTMADNITAQHDLMYSYAQASITDALASFPNVTMTFHHALAWVNFTVKAGDAATAAAITIKNVTLTGAKYSGTYTVTMPNYNSTTNNLSTGLTASWDATAYGNASTAPKNVLSSDGSVALLTTSSSSVGEGILVAPNPDNQADSFTSISVKYSMGGSDYTHTFTPASLVLQPGKKYTFAMTFTLHEIRVVPSVEAWDDLTATDVAIPSA